MAKHGYQRTVLFLETLESREVLSASLVSLPAAPIVPPVHIAAPVLPPTMVYSAPLTPVTPIGGAGPVIGLPPGPGAGIGFPGDPTKTPKGAPIHNADGSTTQVYTDGSWKQTMPAGTDKFGNPTSDVRAQDAGGTVTETTTGSDKNGNPQTTTITKGPGPHGTVIKVTVTTDACTGKQTTVTEIWKWFADPRGHWEHRFGNGQFTGVESDPPPAPTPPAPPPAPTPPK